MNGEKLSNVSITHWGIIREAKRNRRGIPSGHETIVLIVALGGRRLDVTVGTSTHGGAAAAPAADSPQRLIFTLRTGSELKLAAEREVGVGIERPLLLPQ